MTITNAPSSRLRATLRCVLAGLMIGVAVTGCKLRAHPPDAPAAAPPPPGAPAEAAPRVETQAQYAPVEDPFLLPEGESGDPAEELQALRHDCCDEMPVDELKAHVEPSATTQPGVRSPHGAARP